MDETTTPPDVEPAAPHDPDAVARSFGYDRSQLLASARRLAIGQGIIAVVAAVAVVTASLIVFSPWWPRFYTPSEVAGQLAWGVLRGGACAGISLFVAMLLHTSPLRRWIAPTSTFPLALVLVAWVWQLASPVLDIIMIIGVLGGVALGSYLFARLDQNPARMFEQPDPHIALRVAAAATIPDQVSVASGHVRWLLFEHAAHTVSFVASAFLVIWGDGPVIALAVIVAVLAGLGREWNVRHWSPRTFVAVTTAEALILLGFAIYLVSQIVVLVMSGQVVDV